MTEREQGGETRAGSDKIGSLLPASLKEWALKALVASGSAVGFVGFVAVLGGAIMWVRFYAARLPADQAVAVVPNDELVTFGAVTLVTFFVLGGLAVLASYLLDPDAGPGPATRRFLIGLVGIEMAYAIAITPFGENEKRFVLLGLLLVIGIAIERALDRLDHVALTSNPAAQCRDSRQRGPFLTKLALYLLVGVAIVVAGFIAEPELWLGAVLLVAAVLGRAVMRVARLSGDRFGWYAVALFISVVLFGAALNVLRTIDLPQVQPAAVLRKSDAEGVCGFYVTETSERIYLARTDLPKTDARRPKLTGGRIFWVPRKDVTDFALGALQSVRDAAPRAAALRRELLLGRQPQVVSVETTEDDQTSDKQGEKTRTTKKTTKSSEPEVRDSPPVPKTAAPCSE